MIKILLADNDFETLKNFKNFFKINYPHLKDVKSIFDLNDQIIKAIELFNPNIIISDIKYFKSINFSKLEQIHKNFHNTKLILYGNHDELDYLKRSLEFGCIGYIIKPVRQAEFKKNIENALKIINNDNQKSIENSILKNSYMEKFLLFENVFFNNLLYGNFDQKTIQKELDYFDLNFDKDFCIVAIKIDNFTNIVQNIEIQQKHILTFKIFNHIQSTLKFRVILNSFDIICIIYSDIQNVKDTFLFCESIKNDIYAKFEIKVSLGIGNICKNIEHLTCSYNQAIYSLKYRKYIGYNSVLAYYLLESDNNISFYYPSKVEDDLIYTAILGKYDDCVKIVDILLDFLQNLLTSDELIPIIIFNIFTKIIKYASEKMPSNKFYLKDFISFEDCYKISSLEDAKTFINYCLLNFCNFVKKIYSQDEIKLLQKVKDYINSKYYEDISLTSVAHTFDVSPDYLNTIFIKLEDKNFNDFFVLKRLSIAKELSKKIKDDVLLAFKVGYKDPRHFRSDFKKYENIFIEEYLNKYI